MLQIRHKQVDCIGCAKCVEIAPNYWQLDDEGMARLLDTRNIKDAYHFGQGFVDDADLLKDAEDNCPVDIIKVH